MLRHEHTVALREAAAAAAEHPFDRPYFLAATGTDAVVISDMMNHRLVRCELAAQTVHMIGSIGNLGEADGELKCPNGLIINDESIYVVELGNTRLQKLHARTGDYLDSVGSSGRSTDGPGVLRAPCDVACDHAWCVSRARSIHNNNVAVRFFVSDTANNRVVAYEERPLLGEHDPVRGLKEVLTFGEPGEQDAPCAPGQFCGPSGIAVSAAGEGMRAQWLRPWDVPV
jgi:hypothetical protein